MEGLAHFSEYRVPKYQSGEYDDCYQFYQGVYHVFLMYANSWVIHSEWEDALPAFYAGIEYAKALCIPQQATFELSIAFQEAALRAYLFNETVLDPADYYDDCLEAFIMEYGMGVSGLDDPRIKDFWSFGENVEDFIE
jgi:hypothetical protein